MSSSNNNPQNPYMEPIPQKTTVAILNLVVLRYSDFLNKFYAETEQKLIALEKKIDNIDTVLMLLEKKLDSIPPEFFNVQQAANYQNMQQQGEYQAEDQGGSSDAQAQQQASIENDPNREEYEKFIKLHKMGVPLQALRNKMAAEGLDPYGIDKYLDLDPSEQGGPPMPVPQKIQLPPPKNPVAQPPPVQKEEPPKEEEPEEEEEEEEAEPTEEELYAKFVRMNKMGVPLPAIMLKLQAEGLDPEVLKKYIPIE